MIITKFLILLSFLVLLAGCNGQHFHSSMESEFTERPDPPCTSPNFPQAKLCSYAMEITVEADGENPPKGKVAQPVIDDNDTQQKERGKKAKENYPDDEYSLPVKKDDFGKLKKGKFYILYSVPSPKDPIRAELLFGKEISKGDLVKEIKQKKDEAKKSKMKKD